MVVSRFRQYAYGQTDRRVNDCRMHDEQTGGNSTRVVGVGTYWQSKYLLTYQGLLRWREIANLSNNVIFQSSNLESKRKESFCFLLCFLSLTVLRAARSHHGDSWRVSTNLALHDHNLHGGHHAQCGKSKTLKNNQTNQTKRGKKNIVLADMGYRQAEVTCRRALAYLQLTTVQLSTMSNHEVT